MVNRVVCVALFCCMANIMGDSLLAMIGIAFKNVPHLKQMRTLFLYV